MKPHPPEYAPSCFSRLALLNRSEWKTLLLLAEGNSIQDMADRLCITIKSVHNYKNRVGRKLRLTGKSTLTQFARGNREEISRIYQCTF